MALPPHPSPERRAKKAVAGDRLFDPDLVKPSAVSHLSPLNGVRAGIGTGGALGAGVVPKKKASQAPMQPLKPRPPFRPCNPKEARSAITLEHTGFVGMHSPFDLGYRQRQRERQEANQRRIAGTFNPPSVAQ